ncbi:MAG: type II toxin-antitoxin system HicA family toxin [Candidatus Bathyarchaeia archaeon]
MGVKSYYFVKALSKIGYVLNHRKGSHIVMHLDRKDRYIALFGDRKPEYMIVVPAHRPIGKGMLRTIMSEAGLSIDEFNSLT